jgi:1,2-diacylglycerol 3-beta-galactosyltransferase
MRLCDFFIGKPGPGSVSEAVAMRLPVIVERNAWTLPQERYNAEWVREKQVGLVVRGPHQIPGAVKVLLEKGNLARFRTNAAAIRNRAVYEIPGTLRRIVLGPPDAHAFEPEKLLSEQRA